MKKTIHIFVILICSYLIILILSCSKRDQNTTLVKIGINQWTGYDPFILADKMDFFKKNNVRVKIKRYASATEEIKAMKNGEIQGAGFTLDEAFSLITSGFKGKIVLVIDYSMGGDMIIGQKNIRSISELKNKKVGYEGSVVGEFLLDQALHKNYIKSSSVELINVHAKNWLSAFREKRVDALVCFNPVATTLLNKEEGNLLFSSDQIPFEIIDVLVFSEAFYNNNKTSVENILKGWFDSLKFIGTDTDKAAEIISSVKNISPEEYKLSQKDLIAPNLKMNKVVFDPKSDKNIYKYSQVIVDFMISKGLLSKRINTSEIFSSDVLIKINNNNTGK